MYTQLKKFRKDERPAYTIESRRQLTVLVQHIQESTHLYDSPSPASAFILFCKHKSIL